jgi:hypothetical protein
MTLFGRGKAAELYCNTSGHVDVMKFRYETCRVPLSRTDERIPRSADPDQKERVPVAAGNDKLAERILRCQQKKTETFQ